MKKLAVVASGWHFSSTFYEQIAKQKIPPGWEVDLFVVSHRDPQYSEKEKTVPLSLLGFTRRELYDRIMYRKIATVPEIEALGWHYMLEPNTIGDLGCSNQWLEKYDYKKYDKFLFTHDDNFILTDEVYLDILPQEDWLILTNSTGHAQRRLRQWLHLPKEFSPRGSFEFYTREMLEYMGGKFDLSDTKLTREGEVDSYQSLGDLSEWNTVMHPLLRLIDEKKLHPHIKAMSIYYRMSRYCLEGERGFISKTEWSNTKEEERGLDAVEAYYAKQKS
ncbi:MAG: hypothetical protein WC887_02415 [Candidatus Paceibacterota bacterium]|jgi:hypothetical protein